MTQQVLADRWCDGLRTEGFSGERQVPCHAHRLTNGMYVDTCGEPCRWIMKKIGHGIPPWTEADRET